MPVARGAPEPGANPGVGTMEGKILARSELGARLAALRRHPVGVVFTNGCFDILHAGHVRYLAEARRCGDLLVVGLNSDRSVRRIKDPGRPINPQDQRAEVLAALACVDCIALFDEPDPLELIRVCRPDVLVKGADWPEASIVGADLVTAGGGRVVRIAMLPGVSTSAIIQRVLARYGGTASAPEA